MIILGIETSCDETAISIIEAKGDLESLSFETLSHVVHSQIKEHEPFGGVVPNIAKREHQKYLPLVLDKATKEAGNPKIDLIAVTVGPGLEPALWTGIEFAKNLGETLGVKVIGANHMEGHIASVLLNTTEANSEKKSKVEFPAVALLVSGGHTELVYLKNWKEKEKVGETKDDAVGEAFDKVARLLDLPYPGGPQISKLASEAREKNISLETHFPRPMIHSGDLNFSFSGLKTAVLYYLRKSRNSSSNEPCERDDASTRKNSAEFYPCEREEPISGFPGQKVALENIVSEDQFKMAVAREFEDAAIETLVSKTRAAIEKYNPKTLIAGGGVIANKKLREDLNSLKDICPELSLAIPENSLTTDNATMIAISGYIDFLQSKSRSLEANGNLSI